MSGGFLDRWSRRKLASAGKALLAGAPAPAAPAAAEARGQGALATTGARPAHAPDAGAEDASSAVEARLPAVEGLTLASDFTAFLKEEVSEALRRKALQKLFADPHFNRMDGLDIYIDDYSQPDPIPPEAMAKLKSAREWLMANEAEAQAAEAEAEAEAFVLPVDRSDAADTLSDAVSDEAQDEPGAERGRRACAAEPAARPDALTRAGGRVEDAPRAGERGREMDTDTREGAREGGREGAHERGPQAR